MRFDIITIFPEVFTGVFSGGVIKKALERDLIQVLIHDLREFTTDKHRQVDDRPFGGDQGMVMKPEPIFRAVNEIKKEEDSPVVLLSPQGKRFEAASAEKMAEHSQVILICGRYEGVDERVTDHIATHEISIGDYILTGGEPAAVVIVDAVSRYVPQVVGNERSVRQDSFSKGILDHPHYTRPRDFQGLKVPEVLFSGDHKKIETWRKNQAMKKTRSNRPDLLKKPPAE